MLRVSVLSCVALCAGVAASVPAYADTAPVYVIPSRPGIPIIINGRDAAYAVVEGDWGLARPGHMPVTIIGGLPPFPSREYMPRNAYHPRYGRPPERGRNEIEPPPDRPLPDPAESFSRSWSSHGGPFPFNAMPANSEDAAARGTAPATNAGSDVVPATINEPQPYNPTVIVAPGLRRRP
jgi:hypothetical protein